MIKRPLYDSLLNTVIAAAVALIVGASWGDGKVGIITFVLMFNHLVTMDRLRDIRKMLEEKTNG